MTAFFPLLQLLLTAIVVIWDVVLSGSIAQVRALPRPFVIITGLAGFLLLPALVIHLSSTDAITGRSITDVAWLWPLTVLLFAIQAIYAGVRRLVNPFFGFFIAVYNVIVAADAVLRFVATRGTPLPGYALVGLAATSSAFAWITQSPASIASPLFFFVPMTAPAYPALRPSAATFRGFLGLVAFGWIVVILSRLLPADQAVNSYGTHDSRIEKLQERPASDFDIGLKLFPDLTSGPPPLAIRNDLALVDSLGVTVVGVTIIPELMDRGALDSLSRTLEEIRSDSTQLILTLGYPKGILPVPGRNFSEKRRLAAIRQIVLRLHPEILLPAQDPYGAGTLAAGLRPPEFWEGYITHAAAEAKRADRHVRIGVSASSYDYRDSTLYAWASAEGSPVDVPGFSLYPSAAGVRSLEAARGAADRWMREGRSAKDHWVFSTGGFPEAHGEASQERAVWAALAWATSRPVIKGLVVAEAGDYGTIRGIRASDGHMRRVAFAIMRAIKGLRETAAPAVTSAPMPGPVPSPKGTPKLQPVPPPKGHPKPSK